MKINITQVFVKRLFYVNLLAIGLAMNTSCVQGDSTTMAINANNNFISEYRFDLCEEDECEALLDIYIMRFKEKLFNFKVPVKRAFIYELNGDRTLGLNQSFAMSFDGGRNKGGGISFSILEQKGNNLFMHINAFHKDSDFDETIEYAISSDPVEYSFDDNYKIIITSTFNESLNASILEK